MLLEQVEYNDNHREQIQNLKLSMKGHVFITEDYLDCLNCNAITYRKEFNLVLWVCPLTQEVEGFVAFIFEQGQLLVLDYYASGVRESYIMQSMGYMFQKRIMLMQFPCIGFMCVDEQEVVDTDDLGERDEERMNYLIEKGFDLYSVSGLKINTEIPEINHNKYFVKYEFTQAHSNILA